MGKGKSAVLGIIALIIGMSGLGLGLYTFLNPQVIEESKGIEYSVSSETQIRDALDAIGMGYGILTITNNITLSGTIEIATNFTIGDAINPPTHAVKHIIPSEYLLKSSRSALGL